MKSLLLACLILIGAQAHAGQALVAAGANMNFQMATSGRSYQIVAPFAVRAGYRFGFMDVIGEYSYRRSSTGNDFVSIAQTDHEFLLWGRKVFALTKLLQPFAALGAGIHEQVVSTKFGSQNQTEPGAVEAAAAAAGGLELRFSPNISWTLEGRATSAESYSPNPLLGLASYLYVLF